MQTNEAPVLDTKTCHVCNGDGVMYDLAGEPYCETCGGCGDVAIDGSRLEVLSHGAAATKTSRYAPGQVVMHSMLAAEPPFKKGDWVLRRDWQQLAQVKEFSPASGSWEATLDLIIYSRSGERIGRESPAMGGPRGFEPCCPASDWAPIRKPAFSLPKYEPLFRVVKFINPADKPVDDGRL